MKHEDGNLVYSTESGLHCSHCGKPSDQCRCNPSARPGDDNKTVRIGLSQKGHKGKTVTLVQGLSMTPDELKDFARQLKKKTGTGGALKNGIIEIQGDHRERIGGILEKLGWKVKHDS